MSESTWLAVWGALALAIGGVVRWLKSDRVPVDIPPRWRPALAVALGLVGAGVAAAAAGAPPRDAVLGGLGAGVASFVGHLVFVEWLRRGQEFFAPPKGRKIEMPPAEFDALLRDAEKLGMRRAVHALERLGVDIPAAEVTIKEAKAAAEKGGGP